MKQLEEVIKRAQSVIDAAPVGSLRISRSHNSTQYYWKNHEKGVKDKYIKRSEELFAKQLAQKDYAIKLKAFAMKKKSDLKMHKHLCNGEEIINFHEQMSKERQMLITPLVMSDEKYAKLWQEQGEMGYDINARYPIDRDMGIMTEKGELVRSKSEKIIADKLYKMNVPYIYEKPIFLNGNKKVYPDFTVLNKRTRKVYYWEHFGLMEKIDYCEKAIKKISNYQKSGIYQGKQLIVSYETQNNLLNMKEIEGVINEFFL